MRMIVGLGNPGEKYEGTRHNAGFVVLDRLQTEISKSEFLNPKQIQNSNFQNNKKLQSEVLIMKDWVFAKPTTFMNFSGDAMKSLSTFYHILTPNIWVIHDDLDIKIGSYKIQNKGPKVHNGLLSIYEKTGIKDFWHVRIGVDNRTSITTNFQSEKISGEEYVLQKFTTEERVILDGVIEKVTEELMEKVINGS